MKTILLLTSYIPKFFVERKGIAKGVDTFFDDEYLLNEIKTENSNVTSVKRFMRKQTDSEGSLKFIPRQMISVSFLGSTLPKYICINQVRFEVEPFVYPVIQCIKCLRYGHVQQNCKGKERCKNCGETHEKDTPDCQIKCIYCKNSDHNSTSKNCPEFIQQKKIKENMANLNISFNEAKQMQNNSYYNVTTQNKFQALDDVREYPPLPSSSQNIFSKPKSPVQRISNNQSAYVSLEQTKKRKADTFSKVDSPPRRESLPTHFSILPNPYRDEFLNHKNKLIEQVTSFTRGIIQQFLNKDIINMNELENDVKSSVSKFINRLTDNP